MPDPTSPIQRQGDLAHRIACIEAAAETEPGMRGSDWMTLAIAALVVPALLLLAGWGN